MPPTPPPDDFRSRKRSSESELSATVPDIFAPTYLNSEIPNDHTVINLLQAGRIKFPGAWKKDGLPESRGFYQSRACLVAFLEIGDVRADEENRQYILSLLQGEPRVPRVVNEGEIEKLRDALVGFRPRTSYDLATASIEVLCDRLVLVIQGYFLQSKTKEAFIVFPNQENISFLSMRAPKLEFLIFFNHLRHALKSVEWFSQG